MSEREVKADAFNSTSLKKEVISDLEDRYIKLLESRIAHLELQLENRKLESGPGVKDGDVRDEVDAGAATMTSVNSVGPVPGIISEESLEKLGEEEPRYRMVLDVWNPLTGGFQEQSLPGIKEEIPFGPSKEYKRAFTFRKITGIRSSNSSLENDLSSSSEVEVDFPPLRRLLGRITSKWGWPDEVTRCGSPYSPLIYSWEEAKFESSAIIDDESDEEKQARDDLKELLRIISSSSGDARLDRYFKNRDTFLDERTITHDALWTLFPPGSLVVGRPCHDEHQIFVVDSCDGFVPDDGTFRFVCYIFDWNGSEFRRVPFEMEIDGWGGGRKNVTGLPFYPLEFHKEDGLSRHDSIEKLRKRLIDRGDRYVSFCQAPRGSQTFNYLEGEAYFHRGGGFLQHNDTELHPDLNHQQRSSSSAASDHMEASTGGVEVSWKPTEGAVIVDFASYLTYQPANAPILGSLHRYEGALVELSPERRAKQRFRDMYRLDWDRYSQGNEMSSDQLLCCPPRVLGYALKQKNWVQLLVKHLRNSDKADNNTFEDKLQLDSEAKDLISKSVLAHSNSRKKQKGVFNGLDDFAPEKGKGLVIMLYGQPGVGKTLTAESVAQLTGRPLLSVGVADIGIEGDKVETNLQRVFALAGLWEAVLLFDEADVFLEARGEGDNDIRRNAMVSVLLRVLEYYEGILILTTNRMRSLDIAVQSRIHLAIKFVELGPDQKINIFMSFLDQLANKKLIENPNKLRQWVKRDGKRLDFNGRQIRNVISTALGIARADNRKLDVDDIVNVARRTEDFKRDLSTQEAIYRDRQINSRM